jgi:hypothetical protein
VMLRVATILSVLPIVSSQVMEAGSCAGADVDGSGRVSTDDLLLLLSRFGRECTTEPEGEPASCPPPPPPCPAADCTAAVDLAVSTTEAACASSADQMVADALATAAANCTQDVAAAVAETDTAYAVSMGELRADLESQLSAVQSSLTTAQASLAECEVQLTLVRCYVPPIQHGTMSSAESFLSVGDTVEYTCNAGYSSGDGTTTQITSTCQDTGMLLPMVPTCAIIDPCALETDDCDANAQCAMTGPAAHSCECNDGYFGTGQACTVCHVCPAGFSLVTPCASTADTVCVDDCLGVTCGDFGTCSLGACVCTGALLCIDC